MTAFLDKLFHLSARGSDVRTELAAGLTTFLTMAYIIDLTPWVVHFLRESKAHGQSFDERRLDGLRRWRAVAQRAVGAHLFGVK